MLRINRLKIKNFMCVESAELDFTDTEVIVLQGQNGQGKSAVFECIALCLSENKRSLKYNEYVRIGTNEAKIELDCTLNNIPLEFRATILYEKGGSLQRTATYNGKTYTNSEVTTLIKDLELDFYANILFTMQHEEAVSEMSSSWRAHYLQKLFQFDFSKETQTLKDLIADYENTKNESEQQSKFLDKSIKEKQGLIAPVPEKPFDDSKLESMKQEVESLSKYIDEHKGLNDELLKEVESQRQLEQKVNRMKIEQSQWNSHKETIANKKSEIDNFPQLVKPAAFDANSYIERIDNLAKESKEIGSLIELTTKEIVSKEFAIKDFDRKIELAKKGLCPTCGQPTTHLVENNMDEYNELKSTLESLKEKQKTLNAQQKEKDNERYSLQTEKDKAEYTYKVENEQYERETKRLQSLKDDLAKLETETPNVDYDSEIKEIEKEISEITTKIESTKKDLESLRLAQNRKSELDSDFQKGVSALTEINRITESNNVLNQKILEDTINKEANDKEAVAATKQLDYHNEAYKVLTQSLPNFLIIKTCALIESEMNSFMQTVFPTWRVFLQQNRSGVDFFFSKDLNSDTTKKASLRNVRMASGFEKSMLSMAFKVALTKAYNLSFAVLDEVDSDADDENSERMFEQLIESDIFKQIFIITHKPGTRSFIRGASKSSKFFNVVNGKFTEVRGDE